MRKLAETALVVAVSFLTTLIIGTLTNYLLLKGTVSVGAPYISQGENLYPITIGNYSKDPLDGLLIAVPQAVSDSKIMSTAPVQITAIPNSVGSSAMREIRISGIPPRTVVHMLVPAPQGNISAPNVLNEDELHLTAIRTDQLPDSLLSALKSTLWDAFLYAGIIGLFSFLQFSKQEQLRVDLGKLQSGNNTIRDEIAAVKSDSENRYTRLRILMVARLSDYSRELDFWRDTVRKILYLHGEDKAAREAFIREISTSLKTYSTLKTSEDYKAIHALADMLVQQQPSSPPLAKEATAK